MSSSAAVRVGIAGMRLLPRNLLSRLAGRAAGVKLPRALRAPCFRCFGTVVGVDFDELRDPLGEHESLQTFFTRSLREGARPVDPAPDALVSPCDGAWGESGVVEDGLLLQLKGRPYSLTELLADATRAARLEGGAYATLYLGPKDYHRFHAPCAVRVSRAVHVPGTLWPVNGLGLRGVDGLFAQNERIAIWMDACPGSTERPGEADDLCLVAVGATMVGKVRLVFDDLTTNRPGAVRSERSYGERRVSLAPGEECGRFEFGSTLVLLARPGVAALDARPPGTPLRLGERIGRLVGKARAVP
jgi:phosphatidylserine decarboxylase